MKTTVSGVANHQVWNFKYLILGVSWSNVCDIWHAGRRPSPTPGNSPEGKLDQLPRLTWETVDRQYKHVTVKKHHIFCLITWICHQFGPFCNYVFVWLLGYSNKVTNPVTSGLFPYPISPGQGARIHPPPPPDGRGLALFKLTFIQVESDVKVIASLDSYVQNDP